MGSLYQKKKDGFWYAIIKIPGRGKVWKSTGTRSKKIAKDILRHWENEVAKGNIGIIDIEPIGFSDFTAKYLDWAKIKKRPKTIELEISIIENHLKPFFQDKPLDRIQKADIERYREERKKAGVKNRTINLELTLLSCILKLGWERNHLSRLPFEKISELKLKETDSEQRRALSQAEARRLLESASGLTKLFIALLLYTGMRKSEAMFLSWDDIDLEREEITIRAKPEQGFAPKSGKARTIPLHPELKAILEKIPRKAGKGEWVFCDDKGDRIKEFRKSFKTACKKAGLEGISPHCLRHSFASLMIQSGADARTLSEILGHSSPTITLDIYSHCFDSYRRQAINRLPSFEPTAGEVIKFSKKH